MIRSLFLKIFLWFWLAMALIGLALIGITMTTQSQPLIPPQPALISDALAGYSQHAVETLETKDKRALAIYLRSIERKTRVRLYLFNEHLTELSGRSTSRANNIATEVRNVAMLAAQSHETQVKIGMLSIIGAQPQRGRGGKRYVFAGAIPRALLTATYVPLSTRLLRVLAVLLTGGLVCYGLARYVAAPVSTLRDATRRLAAGDLATRVGPELGRRRDELTDLGRDFDLMAERMESLIVRQRRLLGDISHELRSPLARLNLALGLARRYAGDEAAGALDRIERESERMDELIGQLLSLVRLESGDMARHDEPVELQRMVQAIAEDADFEARGRNCSVRVVATTECWTLGTPEFLRSAISNVVQNAVRYSSDGTAIEIALSLGSDERGATQAIINVRDHGPGIPEAALQDVFKPFYRVADARDRQTGGTGLGLAITDRAVRSHGGSVQASNAPGHGLIVELRLPAQAQTSEAQRHA
jgi:two-component system sensor histidine kinase CpxA